MRKVLCSLGVAVSLGLCFIPVVAAQQEQVTIEVPPTPAIPSASAGSDGGSVSAPPTPGDATIEFPPNPADALRKGGVVPVFSEQTSTGTQRVEGQGNAFIPEAGGAVSASGVAAGGSPYGAAGSGDGGAATTVTTTSGGDAAVYSTTSGGESTARSGTDAALASQPATVNAVVPTPAAVEAPQSSSASTPAASAAPVERSASSQPDAAKSSFPVGWVLALVVLAGGIFWVIRRR